MRMGKRFPFIASLVIGVVIWAVTQLFVEGWTALMTVVLIVGIVLFRPEPWAFAASVLLGLAMAPRKSGASGQLPAFVLLLVGGCILEAVVASLPRSVDRTSYDSSSIAQNMVFALIGIALNCAVQFITCPPEPIVDQLELSDLSRLLLTMNCHARRTIEAASTADPNLEYGLARWDAAARFCLGVVMLSPGLWAAFLAALRQLRFRLSDPGRMIKQTLKGLVGATMGSLSAGLISFLCGAGIAVYLLLTPPLSSPEKTQYRKSSH